MCYSESVAINSTHGYWGTALQAAITKDYYHLAHILLDFGTDPSAPGLFASPLICAVGWGRPGQIDFVKRLLSLKVDLEVFDSLRAEKITPMGERYQYNALQKAVYAGNKATI